jgi:hypothetical protein
VPDREPSLKAIALLLLGLVGAGAALGAYGHFRSAPDGRSRPLSASPPPAPPPVPGEPLRLRLYFQAGEQFRLDEEGREISGGNGLGERVRACLEALARGPVAAWLRPLLPAGASIRHVFLDGHGRVYVDLAASVRADLAGKDSEGQRLAVFSIVNTLLANFDDLTAVQLLFEGSEGPRLAGVDLRRPLQADLDLVRIEPPAPEEPPGAGGPEGLDW